MPAELTEGGETLLPRGSDSFLAPALKDLGAKLLCPCEQVEELRLVDEGKP